MATQGEKRSHPESQDILEGIKTLLFDIEGTTTPISFVKEKLFTYVKDNAKSYLENHFDDEECQQDIKALRTQSEEDKDKEGCTVIPAQDEEKDKVLEALVANITWQVEQDSKNSALKQFQGHMYREAYKTGKILGQVYDDFAEVVKSVTSSGRQIYIFSSGSVEAQKLLFGYTEKGDLTAYISGYYDTTTGPKAEKDSYNKIATDIGVKTGEVLFFTDVATEAKCASDAGMKAVLVEREGNAALSAEDKAAFDTITSFSEIVTPEDTPAKRVEKENEESNGAESNGAAEEDDETSEDAKAVEGETEKEATEAEQEDK